MRKKFTTKKPRVRFAPAPTGLLHVGNTRTALITWLYARHHGGTVILRIDDTDRRRIKEEYTDLIKKDLAWLGLDHDDEIHQSARLALYQEASMFLKNAGRLYPCYETGQELQFYRDNQKANRRPFRYKRGEYSPCSESDMPHWRFRVENKGISWHDMIHGAISFHGSKLSDPILVREDNSPLFLLTGIVDDISDGVTHVIRGDDHLSNTALQIQIMEALGKSGLVFGHLPLVKGEQGERLAKRLTSLSLKSLRHIGYEPLALSIYLSRLGTQGNTSCTQSMRELVETFDIGRISKSSPKFSLVELERLNTKLLRQFPLTLINQRLQSLAIDNIEMSFWDVIRHNVRKIKDVDHLLKICTGTITPIVRDKEILAQAMLCLPPQPWERATWGLWTQALTRKTGYCWRDLAMTLRLALTGESHGPEMQDLLQMIGYQRSLHRLRLAQEQS